MSYCNRNDQLSKESYELIGNGCLLLASKFEELDMNIPLIIDFMIANKFKITYGMLKGIQSELVTILDFDLMGLTPYHFITQLFSMGVSFSYEKK